jgi:hypothetical protein
MGQGKRVSLINWPLFFSSLFWNGGANGWSPACKLVHPRCWDTETESRFRLLCSAFATGQPVNLLFCCAAPTSDALAIPPDGPTHICEMQSVNHRKHDHSTINVAGIGCAGWQNRVIWSVGRL